jgi:predicted PurR-regulated permease PerM
MDDVQLLTIVAVLAVLYVILVVHASSLQRKLTRLENNLVFYAGRSHSIHNDLNERINMIHRMAQADTETTIAQFDDIDDRLERLELPWWKRKLLDIIESDSF